MPEEDKKVYNVQILGHNFDYFEYLQIFLKKLLFLKKINYNKTNI